MNGTPADPVYCNDCKSLTGWKLYVGEYETYVQLRCGHTLDLIEWTDQRQMMRGARNV